MSGSERARYCLCSGSLSPRLCATRPCEVFRDFVSFALDSAKGQGKAAHPGVDEPELVLGLLLREPLELEVLGDSLGDSDTARASSEEEDALLLEGDARDLEGADGSGEDNGSGTLDVVVEAAVGFWLESVAGRQRREDGPGVVVAVLSKHGEGEGGVEVFELDNLRALAQLHVA